MHGAAELALRSSLTFPRALYGSYGNLPLCMWGQPVWWESKSSRPMLPEAEMFRLIVALPFQLDGRQVLLFSMTFLSLTPLLIQKPWIRFQQ